MGAFSRGMWLAAAVAALPAGAAAQNAPAPIGAVAALRGSATGQSSDGAAKAPLALNDKLAEGETVATGPDSRLKMALRDGTTLALGADTELKLDHLALAAGAATTLTQLSGYVRAVVAPVRPDKQFEIQTPSMVAAVRGTDWIQNYEAGATQIFVVRGKVLATGAGTYAGDSVVLGSGQGATFSDSAPHTPVVRWKKPKIDRFVSATSLR